MKVKKCNKLVFNLCMIKKLCCSYKIIKTIIKSLANIKERYHRIIQFHQEAWLKVYIDTNTQLRKKAVSDFESNSFKLMNNSVFYRTFMNVRKQHDIKLVTTDKRRNQLVSDPNYHTTKWFSKTY